MRICLLTSEFPPTHTGGIGNYVYNIARRLTERGHKVVVISRGKWYPEWKHEVVNNFDVYRVICLPVYPLHVWLHGLSVSRLLKHIGTDFDVVHIQNPLVPYLKQLSPYVITQHGITRNDIGLRQQLDMYTVGLRIFQHQLSEIDRRIAINANKIIAVSQAKCGELQKFYNISPDNIVVIPNGVDTNFFTPVPGPTQTESEPYILYSGRLDAVKGVNDIVSCASVVCKNHSNVKFIMAGGGRGNLANHIKNRIRAAHLEDNFQFTGFVDLNTLRNYYQNAKACILPSYYEGISLSLLEAMSCAAPCIATEIPGNIEVITKNVDGLLVRPKQPEELAEAILKLLTDEQLSRQLGDNARLKVLKKFDWNIIVDKLEEVYAQNTRKLT